MSDTHCPKCEGKRGFCSKCGKPRYRARRGDVGRAGCCSYARIIPCRGHVETTHACDVCLVPMGQVRPMHWRSQGTGHLYACGPCIAAWTEWQATLADRFVTTRQFERAGT